jgi:hypothetical protein
MLPISTHNSGTFSSASISRRSTPPSPTPLLILFSIAGHCVFLPVVVLVRCGSSPYLDEPSARSSENRIREEPYCGFQIAFNGVDLGMA